MKLDSLSNQVLSQIYDPPKDGLPYLVVMFNADEDGNLRKSSLVGAHETLEQAQEMLREINRNFSE